MVSYEPDPIDITRKGAYFYADVPGCIAECVTKTAADRLLNDNIETALVDLVKAGAWVMARIREDQDVAPQHQRWEWTMEGTTLLASRRGGWDDEELFDQVAWRVEDLFETRIPAAVAEFFREHVSGTKDID